MVFSRSHSLLRSVSHSAQIERGVVGKLHQHPGKRIQRGSGLKICSQFSSQRFKFLLVHNLPDLLSE